MSSEKQKQIRKLQDSIDELVNFKEKLKFEKSKERINRQILDLNKKQFQIEFVPILDKHMKKKNKGKIIYE